MVKEVKKLLEQAGKSAESLGFQDLTEMESNRTKIVELINKTGFIKDEARRKTIVYQLELIERGIDSIKEDLDHAKTNGREMESKLKLLQEALEQGKINEQELIDKVDRLTDLLKRKETEIESLKKELEQNKNDEKKTKELELRIAEQQTKITNEITEVTRLGNHVKSLENVVRDREEASRLIKQEKENYEQQQKNSVVLISQLRNEMSRITSLEQQTRSNLQQLEQRLSNEIIKSAEKDKFFVLAEYLRTMPALSISSESLKTNVFETKINYPSDAYISSDYYGTYGLRLRENKEGGYINVAHVLDLRPLMPRDRRVFFKGKVSLKRGKCEYCDDIPQKQNSTHVLSIRNIKTNRLISRGCLCFDCKVKVENEQFQECFCICANETEEEKLEIEPERYTTQLENRLHDLSIEHKQEHSKELEVVEEKRRRLSSENKILKVKVEDIEKELNGYKEENTTLKTQLLKLKSQIEQLGVEIETQIERVKAPVINDFDKIYHFKALKKEKKQFRLGFDGYYYFSKDEIKEFSHTGKVYKKKLDKDYIKLGSEINKKQVLDKSFKDECLSIALEGFKFNLRFCINEIKQQITDDEVFEMANYYKQKHEKR
ncbi:10360_t:CDS:2 [Funneliformis geosporum]|nr:10360_t:CDS:2 [Funneliformis geosporum]